MALCSASAAALLRRPCAAALRRRRAPAWPPCAALAGARCMAAGSPEAVSVEEDVFPTGAAEAAAPGGSGGAAVRRYAHTLRSGRHTLRGDLMPAAGGGDVGPSPKELAMLALGLCTSMTVRVFADNSRFALHRVGVTVRERCPPGAHVPEARGPHPAPSFVVRRTRLRVLTRTRLQGVEVEIQLHGALTQAQRERLLRAAAGCPVKKMFQGAAPVTTTLAAVATD